MESLGPRHVDQDLMQARKQVLLKHPKRIFGRDAATARTRSTSLVKDQPAPAPAASLLPSGKNGKKVKVHNII